MKQRPDLNQLAKQVFEANKAKGFHDTERSNETLLMLVITELSEAVEADRKGKRADLNSFYKWLDSPNVYEHCFVNAFKRHIKDTIEDELADAVIRLLDLAGLRKVDIQLREANCAMSADVSFGEDFAYSVYYISRCLCQVVEPDNYRVKVVIRNTLEEIIGLCDNLDIDLWQHVELKLKYNATRPHRHGKAY